MNRALLIFSAGVNVALAAAAIHFLNRQTQFAPAPAIERGGFDRPRSEESRTNADAQSSFVTNRFHWRMLESQDYEKYIANLRAVGCPEKTLRDIIVADVRKLYALKTAAVPLKAGFWSCGAIRETAERTRAEQQRALSSEQRELILRLLGSDLPMGSGETMSELTSQALFRFMLGPVPDGVPERVAALMEKSEEASGAIQTGAGGLLLPGDEAKVRQILEGMVNDLKGVMTPEQFEEFNRRAVAINLVDKGFEAFPMTAAEFKEISRLHIDVYGAFDGRSFDGLFSGKDGEDEEKNQEFERRLKTYLGASRFAEYERGKDPEFRDMRSAAEEAGLPAETAVKIFEIKQLLQGEQEQLKEDHSLAAGEREAQARQMAATTQDEVRRLMGPEAFQKYVAEGHGQWLTNFGKP
jgi:hypothetical protein